jgi:hypothetical protein
MEPKGGNQLPLIVTPYLQPDSRIVHLVVGTFLTLYDILDNVLNLMERQSTPAMVRRNGIDARPGKGKGL